MILTLLEAKFPKIPAKVITYRNIKKINKDAFWKDFTEQLNQMSSNAYIDFETACLHTLNKHAPEKKKSQRAKSKT